MTGEEPDMSSMVYSLKLRQEMIDTMEGDKEAAERVRKNKARRQREFRKTRQLADPDYIKRCNLKQNHGLSLDWFNEQKQRQKNRCACCGDEFPDNPKFIHIHHSHGCGDVWDLLCNGCNVAEGHVKTPDRAHKLWKYMERNCIFYLRTGKL